VRGSVDLTSALLKVGPEAPDLGWSPADLVEDGDKVRPSGAKLSVWGPY
jgi:hypothetical protein